MSCASFKKEITESAATGAEPRGHARLHLEICVRCRATFAEQQFLFAAIDDNLRAEANAELPAAFLPRATANLVEQSAPPRSWSSAWALTAVAAAIFGFAALTFLPSKEKQQLSTIETAKAHVKDAESQRVPEVEAPARLGHSSSRFRRGAQVKVSRMATFDPPQVIVPPEEREAFAQFVSTLRQRSQLGAALVNPATKGSDELLKVEPLHISRLEVMLLEDSEERLRTTGNIR